MIQQSKPFIKKSDFDYIDEIVKSSHLATGRFVKQLQKEFCKMHSVSYAHASSSGTTALHLALLALNIKEENEVVVPSYTCTALLNAINYVRAIPKIADINPETFNLTYSTIKKKITRKTKAIIVTHTFGFPADIDEILKFGIPVIEDCAQAIGSKYKGKLVGTKGIISIFSMYATKMLTAGEGGMICTNDKKISETVYDLNNPDMREKYRIRYNYKMSDLAAGLALSQLRKLPFFVNRRISIARCYKKSFSSLPVTFQKVIAHTVPNYYRFIICTLEAERIIKFVQKQMIMCDKPIYKPLHHYLTNKGDSNFKGTDFVWDRAISIPIYPALSDEKISKIIDVVTKYF